MIKVSVIIPTFNRKDYLKEALESVFCQSFRLFEIIVIDDGSSDGTREMIQNNYGTSIKYYWQENQGESIARNQGIEIAQGEYIALLDSDDRWLEDKLAKQVEFLEINPSSGMVFSQAWIIEETGKRIKGAPWGTGLKNVGIELKLLLFNNMISGPSSTLIRRSVFENVGDFDANIRYGEDWDLWLRIAKQYPIAFIEEPLIEVRRHRNSQCYYPSSDINRIRLADHLLIIEKAANTWSDPSSDKIKERAYAHQYSQTFLAEAAVGNYQSSRGFLQNTISLAPQVLKDTDVFGRYIINNGAIIAEESKKNNFSATISYVKWILDELASVGIKENYFIKFLWAELYAMLGFLSFEKDDFNQALKFLLIAIMNNPRMLENRGILSVIIMSILGKNNYERIRNFVGRSKNKMD